MSQQNSGQAEVRQFSVVGGPEVFGQKAQKRGGGAGAGAGTRKKATQEGGTEIATAGVVPLAQKTPVTAYRAPSNLPLQGPPISAAFQPLLATGGAHGTTTRKVFLQKSDNTHKKVHLNPKKNKVLPVKGAKVGKTRKISLGLPTLHRRITRARRIRKDIDEIPIEKLKEKLIKAGLVRDNTKAPESVLRQIASDARILGEKGL